MLISLLKLLRIQWESSFQVLMTLFYQKNVTFDDGALGVKFGIFTLRGQSTVFLENHQADNHWSAKHPQNKAFSPNLKIDSDNIQCSSSTACK
jgi:hypothetical protein